MDGILRRVTEHTWVGTFLGGHHKDAILEENVTEFPATTATDNNLLTFT
jgi:hypothetical protein